MDLNYFLAREQVERALARAAVGDSLRREHNVTADRYRDQIDRWRRTSHGHVDASTLRATGAPRPA